MQPAEHDTPTMLLYVGSAAATSFAVLEWCDRHGGAVERVDGRDRNALTALTGDTLFGPGGPVCIEHAQALTVEDVGAIGTARVAVGSIVVDTPRRGRGAHPLAGAAQVIYLDDAAVEALAVESFRTRGIELEPDARRVLARAASIDPTRVRSAARAAAMAGLARVSGRVLDRLLGGVAADVRVYDVADALWRGEVARAILLADACEPIPLALHVCDTAAVTCLARSVRNPDRVAQLASIHPYAAKLRVQLAGRHSDTALIAALQTAVALIDAVFDGTYTAPMYVAAVHAALTGPPID